MLVTFSCSNSTKYNRSNIKYANSQQKSKLFLKYPVMCLRKKIWRTLKTRGKSYLEIIKSSKRVKTYEHLLRGIAFIKLTNSLCNKIPIASDLK